MLHVREIIRLCQITPVPNMPPHVRGVINLRGTVIPVLDLRAKLSMAALLPRAGSAQLSPSQVSISGEGIGRV